MSKLQRSRLAFLFLVLSSVGLADIREIKEMREILPHIDAATLVIFDLDNTIMEPVQTLGSDQWFEHRVKQHVAAYLQAGEHETVAIKKALARALDEWRKIQKVTRMKAVEAVTPNLIRNIQGQRIPTMGLTARPSDLSLTTRGQLTSLGVNLEASSVAQGNIVILPSADPDADARFVNGIIYSGVNPKGDILVRFLNQQVLKPRKIIFVDDKLKNCQSVEAFLDKTAIPHISFRYGAADATVAAFSQQVAGIQLKFFGRILGDKEAGILLKALP